MANIFYKDFRVSVVITYMLINKSLKWDLKMLGLYLYTLLIDNESCNMFSILNKLTLQKEF